MDGPPAEATHGCPVDEPAFVAQPDDAEVHAPPPNETSAVAGSVEAFLPADTYQFQDFVQDLGASMLSTRTSTSCGRAVFSERLSSIAAHNSDPTKTWKSGVNEFADVTREEFKSSLEGWRCGPVRTPSEHPGAARVLGLATEEHRHIRERSAPVGGAVETACSAFGHAANAGAGRHPGA